MQFNSKNWEGLNPNLVGLYLMQPKSNQDKQHTLEPCTPTHQFKDRNSKLKNTRTYKKDINCRIYKKNKLTKLPSNLKKCIMQTP